MSFNKINVGQNISKFELSELIDESTLKTSREGIFNCKKSNSTILFVTLDKVNKPESLTYNDYFEDDWFHWDSQNKQNINTPGIRKIVEGINDVYLFARINDKIKSKTVPFTYCGELVYDRYDKATKNPVHITFLNVDYDDFTKNNDLLNIYLWSPGKEGKKTSNKIIKKGVVSIRKKILKRKYIKTDIEFTGKRRAEQPGLRKELLDGRNSANCTLCNIERPKSMLVAGHIKKRSECTNEEINDSNVATLICLFGCDVLFEEGFISVNDTGRIEQIKHINNKDIQSYIDRIKNNSISNFNSDNAKYYKWHYNNHIK